MHWMAWANKYRIHVYAVFAVWFGITLMSVPVMAEYRSTLFLVYTIWLAALIWVYLFNKIYDTTEDAVSQPDEVTSDSENKKIKQWSIGLLAYAVGGTFWLGLPLWPLVLYLFVGFLYSYPVGGWFRLKQFIGIKNISATFFFLFPFFASVEYLFLPFYTIAVQGTFQPLEFYVGIFIFLVMGELLWDVRDMDGDKAAGIRTVPNTLGLTTTKWLAAILFTFGLTVFISDPAIHVLQLISFGFLMWSKPSRPVEYYHAYLYSAIVYGFLTAYLLIMLYI